MLQGLLHRADERVRGNLRCNVWLQDTKKKRKLTALEKGNKEEPPQCENYCRRSGQYLTVSRLPFIFHTPFCNKWSFVELIKFNCLMRLLIYNV